MQQETPKNESGRGFDCYIEEAVAQLNNFEADVQGLLQAWSQRQK